MVKSLIKAFFYGNYFYGVCAVMLSIEASLQQQYVLNSPYFYVLVFAITVWFYTLAYIKDPSLKKSRNPRTQWYINNRTFIVYSQWICVSVSGSILIYIAYIYWAQMLTMNLDQWIPLLLTPLAALLYYGISFLPTYNLRRIGWLKPFVIGFTWAGLITLAPVIFYHVSTNSGQGISLVGWWLLLKNFMFVSVLCIMFDIKDYAADSNRNIKTFVVKRGIRYTIFAIILPFTLAGIVSFLVFAWLNHFSVYRIWLNILPFIAMLIVAYALRERRTIFFYLVVIDGLMFFKAICGIVAYYVDHIQ